MGLRLRLRAPLKGSPSSSLPAATLAFASRHRNRSSAVSPSFAVAAAAPAVLRRRSRHRRRSGRTSSWSPSRRRPRPPLRRRRRSSELRRRRQPEGFRRFLLVAVVVRCVSAAVLITGVFAALSSTCWCPSFASSRRRSPASVRRPSRPLRRAAAAAGDVIADVIGVVRREPPWTRLISTVRFGLVRSRPSGRVNRRRAPGPPQTLAADAIILLFLFKNNSLLRHNSIKINLSVLIRF